MERRQKRHTEAPRKTLAINSEVLWICKLTQLSDAFNLMGLPNIAQAHQQRALKTGVKVITLATQSPDNQLILDNAMEKLRENDREMHERIEDVLAQAQAVKTTTEEIKT